MTVHPEPKLVVPEPSELLLQESTLVLSTTSETPALPPRDYGPNLPVESFDVSTVPADTRKDEQVDDGVPGCVGLYNIGNTCFMNSALQCLLATPALKDVFQGDYSNTPIAVSFLKPMLEKLQEMFKKIYSGKYCRLLPKDMHTSVSNLHPLFGDYKQHDSQEFISFVLNIIHDFLNLSQESLFSSKQNDDFSDNITGEVSKRLKMDSASSSPSMDTDFECEEESLTKAELAWRVYLKRNKTAISDRFQGQYQSVITCQKCGFVSTTFEPFMMLSLSIPHAMEKQIVVTWVPSPKMFVTTGLPRVKRYLVTVKKSGMVQDLKTKFFEMLKAEEDGDFVPSNIVFAEVKNHANVKIIDNKTQIQYLSKSHTLYAMEPVNNDNNLFADCDTSGCHDTSMTSAGSDDGLATWHTCNICFEEKFEEDLLVHRSCNGTLCAGCLQSTIAHGQSSSGDFPCPSCNRFIDAKEGYEPMRKKPRRTEPSETTDGHSTFVTSVSMTTDDPEQEQQTWRKCSICLNETFDEEIRTHASCGGLICQACLVIMTSYHDNQNFQCPTCSVFINGQDYIKISNIENETRPMSRKVIVPVLFRYKQTLDEKAEKKKFTLFGSPHICCLKSELSFQHVEEVTSMLLQKYNIQQKCDIVITDSTGTSCGFCDFTSGCTGCRINDITDIKLKPGCCLSITFHEEEKSVLNALNYSKDDETMKLLRNSDVVTLTECMEHFAQIERLTEDNPWFCPRCQANQVSEKEMRVTRWPGTLIIHLKRFHFEESQGNKISCPIDFPLSDLNVDLLSCPNTLKSYCPTYDLYAAVNHMGSLFGGHYTAFTKHDDEWYNFNDETFKKMHPTEDADYQKEGYVLFYQIKGS